MTHSSDRAAWLAARRLLVTASDVAAILGESKYKTREQLRMEKAGLAEEWAGSEQTDIGLDLEPAIARMAMRKFGWKLHEAGVLRVDASCPLLGATPDYLLLTPQSDLRVRWRKAGGKFELYVPHVESVDVNADDLGLSIVQIKATTCQATEDCKPQKSGAESTAVWSKGPPLDYQLQVQTELAVTGAEWGALLVLHLCAPCFKLRAYPIRRHEAVIARIRAEVPIFMAEVDRLKRGEL
jgi:putative phage-type endonuclease